jgi:hypothetical protein
MCDQHNAQPDANNFYFYYFPGDIKRVGACVRAGQ